jgi:hypothetical protein
VTIGHHTRIYFAFVTTAPAGLESPATVALYAAPLADVAFFAAGQWSSTPLANEWQRGSS